MDSTGNDCNDNDASSTSISNDTDCDGVPNSADAFPNDSSQWEPWTLCGSFKHSNATDGFSFLVTTWGSSNPSLSSEGNFCADMPMNQLRAEVHASSSGGIVIDTGIINVGSNPFYYGHTNQTWSNGSGVIGLTTRASWEPLHARNKRLCFQLLFTRFLPLHLRWLFLSNPDGGIEFRHLRGQYLDVLAQYPMRRANQPHRFTYARRQ